MVMAIRSNEIPQLMASSHDLDNLEYEHFSVESIELKYNEILLKQCLILQIPSVSGQCLALSVYFRCSRTDSIQTPKRAWPVNQSVGQ